MYPNEARLRKLTYAANLYIDIHHKTVITNPLTNEQEIVQHPTLEKYPCGKMPIMVGSKYCVLSEQNNLTKMDMGEGFYDYGGYFIVKGSEKLLFAKRKSVKIRYVYLSKKVHKINIQKMLKFHAYILIIHLLFHLFG